MCVSLEYIQATLMLVFGMALFAGAAASAPDKTKISSEDENDPWRRQVGVEGVGFAPVNFAAPEAGISLGIYLPKSIAWEMSLSYANIAEKFDSGITRSNFKWSVRGQFYIYRTLYLLAGSALQQEKYQQDHLNLSQRISDDVVGSYAGPYTWTSTTWGAEAGVGNRWFSGTYYFGVEWFEIYRPLTTIASENLPVPRGIGDAEPSKFSIKLLALQCGLVW